jgi:uncharacterized protein YydD (DUF2326 family)
MFLKTLTISSHDRVIREIKFHNGINLIVDETPNTTGNETGNSVGKTTVLMLIDYCLGGDAKQIYTEPEHRKEEYKLVKDFLIDNEVLVSLVLKEDLSEPGSREILIERNFLPRSRKVLRINGVPKTQDSFEDSLQEMVFPDHFGKPTFRQIISHNIRYNELRLTNTLRTLDRFTSDAEYESLHLFLFGCSFIQAAAKQELLGRIRIEQTFKARLEKNQTKSAYETLLAILEGEIKALDRRKANFNLNENFEAELNQLNRVKFEINSVSSEIGRHTIKRDLIAQARNDLEKGIAQIDLRQLEAIYRQATDQIGGIQKTFEELCEFHNRMIEEKIRFISQDLPRLETDLKAKSEQLNRLLQQEAQLSNSLARSDSFSELEELIGELNEKYRSKGEYENILLQLGEVEAELKSLNQKLDEIDNELFSNSFELKIKEQLNKFNRHFSAVSKELYGEQYALKVDPETNKRGQRLYKFSSFNTNLSSGKKQGEISCFDIAYILFADEENIPCLHFLLNDKKELMHDNQILKIAQVVNRLGIQFVASILKDKLPGELNQSQLFVVKLSQEDKLFRIEGN